MSGRVIVTGGAGFIGSALVRLLLAETGYRVVTVDALTYAGNRASLEGVLDDPRHELRVADVADEEAMRDLFDEVRPEAVLHLAAESHVDRSIDGPAAFVRTNVVGTFTLLEAARRYLAGVDRESGGEARERFRFVHVSTDEVFGSLGPEGAFTEDTPYDPRSPYSASKAASDHFAKAYWHTYGVPVIVTNCSNNYGPRQYPEKLIPTVVLKGVRGEAIPVYGAGDNVRDWLHVEDHARGLLAALTQGRPGETYALGGRNEQRNLDLVHLLCDLLDELRPGGPGAGGRRHRELIEFVTDRPGHDKRYAIDADKAERELGWRARVPFREGLRETVRWYLDNPTWVDAVLARGYALERQGTAS